MLVQSDNLCMTLDYFHNHRDSFPDISDILEILLKRQENAKISSHLVQNMFCLSFGLLRFQILHKYIMVCKVVIFH